MSNRIYEDDDLRLLYLMGETDQLKVKLFALGETQESIDKMFEEIKRDEEESEKARHERSEKFWP